MVSQTEDSKTSENEAEIQGWQPVQLIENLFQKAKMSEQNKIKLLQNGQFISYLANDN